MSRVRESVQAALPEALRERARLALATALELRARRSPAKRGAAIVLHASAPAPGDEARELDPPIATAVLAAIARRLRRRYRPVRAGELLGAVRERRPGEPVPVALTFDDDLPSHTEHALGALRASGVVATAFLCLATSAYWWQRLQAAVDAGTIEPERLGPVPPELVRRAVAREPWALARLARAIEQLPPAERDRVAEALAGMAPGDARLLDAGGAGELVAAGWELGEHTRGHYVLTTLDDDALERELERRELAPGAGLPRALAYPHGKAAEREARAAERAGYEVAFTTRAATVGPDDDPHLVGRLQPRRGSPGRFALDLARALDAGVRG